MRISIITPSLDAGRFISSCLESVNKQTYDDIEHIVVDGGSADLTVNIAKAAGAKVIIAPGTSIYEALNLGIASSSGQIIAFLNADDKYAGNWVLETIMAEFKENKESDIVYGNCEFINSQGKCLYTLYSPRHAHYGVWKLRVFNISHPSWFARKSVLLSLGCYNTKLKFISDCDIILRALEQKYKFKYIQKVLSRFTLHDANASRSKSAAEEFQTYFKAKIGTEGFRFFARNFLLTLLYLKDPRYFLYRLGRK